MERYRRRAGLMAVLAGATALAALACSGNNLAEPTAAPIPPVQQVAGDLSFQELLPPSRQGIAPALQDDAVTPVSLTPTPRPTISEALARRIAEQEFTREILQIRFPEIEPAGTFLTTRRLLIALSEELGRRFTFSPAGDQDDQFWVVNFRVVGPVNLPARFVGAVVDARSGDSARIFTDEPAVLQPPRISMP